MGETSEWGIAGLCGGHAHCRNAGVTWTSPSVFCLVGWLVSFVGFGFDFVA